MDWQHLFGFDCLSKRLSTTIVQGNLPQAVLIEGREGMGKRLFAAKMAAFFWCETQDACGHCADCSDLKRQRHPEVMWLEPEAGLALKVEQADEVQTHLELSSAAKRPYQRRLVCIIDFDRFSQQAVNRLLKSLEEPAHGTGFILTTSQSDRLLPTVLSRVMRLYAPVQSKEATATALIARLTAEGFTERAKDSELVASTVKISGYAFGAAYKALTSEGSGGTHYQFLADLIDCKDTTKILDSISAGLRGEKITAATLVIRLEIVVNQLYRNLLNAEPDVAMISFGNATSNSLTRPSVAQLYFWRRLLREAKALAVHSKVPLNAQMIAESWILGQYAQALTPDR